MLSLIPSKPLLLSCKAASQSHVSLLHNTVGTKAGEDSLVLKDQIFHISSLKNASIVNKDLRIIQEDEKHLGIFLFYNHSIQCLEGVKFSLNNVPTTCATLQVVPLPASFRITYNGKYMNEFFLKSDVHRNRQDCSKDFAFSNLPRTMLEEEENTDSILTPLLDNMILSPARQLSPLKISGRFVLFLIIFAISCACCCWKSKGFRDWWIAAGGNLKKCLTT